MTRFLKQELENRLLSMGGAEFQELCDSMLYHIYRNKIIVYNRVGHQLGKSKTIAGTPDTFFLLGKDCVVFTEATTKADEIYSKLASDIASCLDKTKIDIGDLKIQRIVLCYNNRIDVDLELRLQSSVNNEIIIEHYGIDRIVETIINYQPWLAESINFCINKPGIYSLDKFIEKYNITALKFSSPLNSKFVCREKELSQMSDMMKNCDILMVAGDPGVGKTRLVVEYLKTRFNDDHYTNIIVIEENATEINNSILPLLSKDQDNIVFIDDVNRKTAIFDALLSLQSSTEEQIKIVLTIRGYAFNDFAQRYPLIKDKTVFITPLPETSIKDVLESEPYCIRNIIVRERIENISMGNMRISIMCAELVKRNGFNSLIKDVVSLYDAYFSEHVEKLDCNQYKVLSACAIFRCLKEWEDSTCKILNICEIDKASFKKAITSLEQNECVDAWTYDDGKAIKVVDQIFATYLVYDSIFKKRVYSLDTILELFFHTHKKTIIDSLSGVVSSYQNSNIGDILSASANLYAEKVKDDSKLYNEAIDSFGFYMPEKVLDWYDNIVQSITKKESQSFTTAYKTNDFSFNQDHIITLLIQYFHHKNKHSNLAFEILYDYCDRCPEKLPELTYWIRKNVLYTKNDYLNGLPGLRNFVEHLFSCLSRYNCCLPLFFAISETMLEYNFSTDVVKGRTFVLNRYTLCSNEEVVGIRKMVIEKLSELNKEHHSQVLDVLMSYKACHEECASELVKIDIKSLTNIIPNIILPSEFRDILVVNHLRDILGEVLGKTNETYLQLTSDYRTDKYVRYKALDFRKIRGKSSYDFDDICNAKRGELKEYYLVENINDVTPLVQELKEYTQYLNIQNVSESLIQIIILNLSNNYSIGCLLFERLLESFPELIICGSIGSVLFQVWTIGKYKQFLDDILNYKGKYKYYLLFKYCNIYFYQSVQQIDQAVCDYMKLALLNLDYKTQLALQNLRPFGDVSDYVSVIQKHNYESSIKIEISDDGFCDKSYFANEIDMAVEIFKQQVVIDSHFDYDNKIIAWLYDWDASSLYNMLDFLSENGYDNSLSFVFSNTYNYAKVDSIISRLNKSSIRYKDLNVKNLFEEIRDDKTKNNAVDFIQKYIDANIDNQDEISIIIDASRSISRDIHDEFLLYYLNNYNNDQSIENFDFWIDRLISYGGDTTYGDIIESRWQSVMKVAEKVTDIRRRNKIVMTIKKNIERARLSSIRERGERFLRE